MNLLKAINRPSPKPNKIKISLVWPTANKYQYQRDSFYMEPTLKEQVDEMLLILEKLNGKKMNRNQFIMRAINYYLADLASSKSVKELKDKLCEK